VRANSAPGHVDARQRPPECPDALDADSLAAELIEHGGVPQIFGDPLGSLQGRRSSLSPEGRDPPSLRSGESLRARATAATSECLGHLPSVHRFDYT
jgi:hypothetical protein